MIKPIFKTPKTSNYFFGYYDKSPVNIKRNIILAMKVEFIDKLPTKDDFVEIGYFNLDGNKSFHSLTSSRAYNWQQGCMLQWIDDDRFIFNDLYNKKFVSKIFNLSINKTTILKESIYSFNPKSKLALCIDNERHYWCRRGYSYDGIQNVEKNVKLYLQDGIFSLCIKSNNLNKIISITDVIDFRKKTTMDNSEHYLEHIMINPNCTRFAFFHRWKTSSGTIFTRLYTANLDGSDLFLLNDSGRMSHYCWKNNLQIIGWGGIKNSFNSIRENKLLAKFFIDPLLPLYKKLVKGNAIDGSTKLSKIITGDSYILFTDKSNRKQRLQIDELNKDGHPSVSPIDENILLTDTYPDDYGKCYLILCDLIKRKTIILDELNSIKQYDNSVNRCDLHPKWSNDGKYICIDTMNDGMRSMYLYLNPFYKK